jgi:hypothetical protein
MDADRENPQTLKPTALTAAVIPPAPASPSDVRSGGIP